ncbi:MAG: hypothetical protein BWX88_05033 [Planctomycetes bacterium ADurb.Bin126]|nr:MAG: hypothetical protein BWX88_05033 [Planctomycetes bacterium ADurb.Bin126]
MSLRLLVEVMPNNSCSDQSTTAGVQRSTLASRGGKPTTTIQKRLAISPAAIPTHLAHSGIGFPLM